MADPANANAGVHHYSLLTPTPQQLRGGNTTKANDSYCCSNDEVSAHHSNAMPPQSISGSLSHPAHLTVRLRPALTIPFARSLSSPSLISTHHRFVSSPHQSSTRTGPHQPRQHLPITPRPVKALGNPSFHFLSPFVHSNSDGALHLL